MSSTQDRDDGRGDRITTLNTGWKQIRRPKPEKTSCKRKQTRRENAKDEKATIRNTQQRQKRTQNETVKTQVNKHQSLTTTRKHSQNTSVVRFPFGSVRAVLTRHVLGGRGQSYHTTHTHTPHTNTNDKRLTDHAKHPPTHTHTPPLPPLGSTRPRRGPQVGLGLRREEVGGVIGEEVKGDVKVPVDGQKS